VEIECDGETYYFTDKVTENYCGSVVRGDMNNHFGDSRVTSDTTPHSHEISSIGIANNNINNNNNIINIPSSSLFIPFYNERRSVQKFKPPTNIVQQVPYCSAILHAQGRIMGGAQDLHYTGHGLCYDTEFDNNPQVSNCSMGTDGFNFVTPVTHMLSGNNYNAFSVGQPDCHDVQQDCPDV
jgi:hypothetical protein